MRVAVARRQVLELDAHASGLPVGAGLDPRDAAGDLQRLARAGQPEAEVDDGVERRRGSPVSMKTPPSLMLRVKSEKSASTVAYSMRTTIGARVERRRSTTVRTSPAPSGCCSWLAPMALLLAAPSRAVP